MTQLSIVSLFGEDTMLSRDRISCEEEGCYKRPLTLWALENKHIYIS